VIQYFISWAEAELPIEESQNHYTEQLQLIPNGKIHQYYTPRVLVEVAAEKKGGKGKTTQLRARLDGRRFDHLTRNDFHELPAYIKNSNEIDTYVSDLNTNNNGINNEESSDSNDKSNNINLYVCKQKPFKVFPEFDELVCGILKKDLNGHIILHKPESKSGGYNHHELTFVQRMMNAGCDMERIHFISAQPPHKLLKLYSTANVVLDSYPAGGCTTTREALELGKAVVTWPARLLGGRWTLGLYNIIGITERIKSKLIASNVNEYITMAVNIGTNHTLRNEIEIEIKSKTESNLFYRKEAIAEWEKILLEVSPVKQCNNDINNDSNDDFKDEL
jgi:hypothetical protein